MKTPAATLRDSSPLAARWLAACVLALVPAARSHGATNALAPPSNLAELRERIDGLIGQPRFAAAQWGVEIVAQRDGRLVYSHNTGKLFVPASNTKLFTGALALDRLGAEFRIRTSLYAGTRPNAAGTLRGDLVVYGRGDPSLQARLAGGSLNRTLEPLVEAVAAAGIKRLQGDLVADESYFPDAALGSGWNWDDLPYYYGAEVSALTLNDNAVEVLVKPAGQAGERPAVVLQPPAACLAISNMALTVAAGTKRDLAVDRPLGQNVLYVLGGIPAGDPGLSETISIHRPALWFGQALVEALRARGIAVSGRARAMDWRDRVRLPLVPGSWLDLGGADSPPLGELLARMLKPSQNLHAQLLLLQVGMAELAAQGLTNAGGLLAAGRTPPSPERAGLAAMGRFLAKAGIERGTVTLEEGSGLSRRDAVTPHAAVRLLQFMQQHPQAAAFRDALPVAGVDGTLRNRLKGTAAAGNARAKTGTLSLVNALSGYVTNAAGESLVFSLFLNQYAASDPNRSARADLDTIVEWLAAGSF